MEILIGLGVAGLGIGIGVGAILWGISEIMSVDPKGWLENEAKGED